MMAYPGFSSRLTKVTATGQIRPTPFADAGLALVFCLGLLVAAGSHAIEPDYLTSERADTPSTAREMVEPIQALLREPRRRREQRPLPDWKKDAAPFWRDSTLVLKPRSYFLNRSRKHGDTNEAWVLGGALEFVSGKWLDRFDVGATLYTSQKLYGPADKDGTLLLKPGQKSFSALAEAWLGARLFEGHHLRVGRQSFNLPYINRRDLRMVPTTFEAVAIRRPSETGLAYIAGYLSRIKLINQNDFISMSKAAGADGVHKGLAMAGARYTFSEDTTIGAINQYSFDVMNTLYVEADTVFDLIEGMDLGVSTQYTDQRSIGNALIGNFETYTLAGKLDLGYKDAVLTLAASRTGNQRGMQSPYGSPATFLSIIVDNFDRAGEKAVLLGLSYNFKGLGLNGLSSFANIAHGNTPDSGANASPDETEYDLTIDYRFRKGTLDGLWARVRGAYIDQDDNAPGADDFFDFRIILNYEYDIF